MEIDRNGMEVLDRAECLNLLRSTPIGRVVVTLAALPAAFPVNFALMGEDVVFMTGRGTKLQAALRNAVVAFEADGFESMGHTGWSVLVQGHASEISDPSDQVQAHGAGLGAWVPKSPTEFVRVRSEVVSGRRLSIDAAAAYRCASSASVSLPLQERLETGRTA
jgi:nitroimidazol reductase NimA-like FMN-containing flavoprotein (pyridoxamine 5'-phosphate oxidase superfamily)